MQIVSQGDNLHKMSILFSVKIGKISSISRLMKLSLGVNLPLRVHEHFQNYVLQGNILY